MNDDDPTNLRNRIVHLLIGPTGSGKTSLGIAMAMEYAALAAREFVMPEETELSSPDRCVRWAFSRGSPENYTLAAIVSVDYFYSNDQCGHYGWDADIAMNAKHECFRGFINALSEDGRPRRIIVDNPNITPEDRAPYILAALAFKYDVELIRCKCDPDVSWNRSERMPHVRPKPFRRSPGMEEHRKLAALAGDAMVPEEYRNGSTVRVRDVWTMREI